MEAIQINDFNNGKIEESEVIRRVLGGEKELYELLIRRNNQKLYRVVRSYLKEEAEIEDAMQNTYLKAFEKLYQFNHNSTFSTWLIRIGINEALLRLREKGKMFNMSEQGWNSEDALVFEIQPKNQMNPQKRIIMSEAKQLLENAVDQLEIKYKTVYILKEVEGMRYREIAEVLDLTVSNVKVRVHRAKAMLKEKLYALSVDKSIFEFGFERCDRLTENVMASI
ncbi:RNA polymerase sigma factor [Pricia sp. S334]|uniref:RNA polymerase sigma factor n=1 Tax=Pricia mediterranea TaxID=3076079 RepID=A0ABU3L722_9FLAO|nr:RNA polymerase sigma factor [Pricia sp. S334]MDT7829470.1 RNA polymerase sigma factor [Pricia sp. S334]